MKKWPRFDDIFAFHPPSDENNAHSLESINDERLELDDIESEGESNLYESEQTADYKETWHKIRFDNTIRLLISIPTYLVCFALWFSGGISSILPMTIVFASFGGLQFLTTWFFMNNRFARKLDYFMSTTDLISMTCAIYFSGGSNSPLYFIYFIPLLVHAFHRDWRLVLFYGVGGGVLYAGAVLNSLSEYSSATLTNLGSRLFFMFVTLGIVYFAVTLLEKKDVIDRLRMNRLRALTLIGRRLNKVSTMSELPMVVTSLIKFINQGLGARISTWTRFLLINEEPSILRAIADPSNNRPDLKQELAAHTCPAMKSGKPFLLESLEQSMECPVEKFNFGSHVCVPVIGSENESFGVLFSGSLLPNAFRNEELQFLHHVARSLALSIQRLQRMEELRKAVEMNSCVMAAYIGSARSLQETYKSILEGTATVLKADQVTLMLWHTEKALLQTVDIFGPHTFRDLEYVSAIGEGVAGRTLEKKEAFWTTDFQDNALGLSRDKSVKALLCLPMLTFKGEPLGVLTAVRTEERSGFSMTEISTASTFATRAALAIENAILHQKERNLHLHISKTEAERRAA